VKFLISLNLLKLRSAVIGELWLEWPKAPFPWAYTEIFPGVAMSKFCFFQVADDAMKTDIHKALYPFYAKRNCRILRQ